MGKSDATGSGHWSDRRQKVADAQRSEADTKSDWASNIEVGDFVSDLAVAIRYRDRLHVQKGDWIEEPARAFTDGLVFGEEISTPTQGKLQITLTLDQSLSMYNRQIQKYAGPTFQAIDQMIRKAAQNMPEGTIRYAPFIFHEVAFKLPEAYRKYLIPTVHTHKRDGIQHTQTFFCPYYANVEDVEAGIVAGEIDPRKRYSKLVGNDTLVAPLFQAISEWEKESDPEATRLDIIITDGLFEDAEDVVEATRIQELRNGKLNTVLLNFLPINEWGDNPLPERCIQYPVTTANLNNSVRTIVNETIVSML